MKPRQKPMDCGHGYLPAQGPLANPYVPFQNSDPPRYASRKGIVRGTVYPGLDLPFQGRVNRKELPVTGLSELQALGFAIQELALYLDTHRDDKQSLGVFRDYQRRYHACREQYEKKYGPLLMQSMDDCPDYRWIDGPWPWEYRKNKGV